MWIEHRLREAYVGGCAAIIGGILFSRFHRHVTGTLQFPYDIVATAAVWVSLAVVAVAMLRLWRARQLRDQQERGTNN